MPVLVDSHTHIDMRAYNGDRDQVLERARMAGVAALVDVGCESCHGPGEKHIKAEGGGDMALQQTLQKAMKITVEESKTRQCDTCHDLDNSPDFDFDTYWPFVEHHDEEEGDDEE